MLVNEQIWVEFHIGGYKDKVLCYIIPMDVCHVLFGRPWYYGRNAKHDGRKNTYITKKDGVSYTLTPLKDEDKTPQVESNVMIVGEKEFIKAMKEENIGFSIIVKPQSIVTTTKKEEFPLEIQNLLKKYADIVVDELPNTLPPMRDISHHIDFIPRASLPNKVSYKMTPQ